jgi:hypothetical protein
VVGRKQGLLQGLPELTCLYLALYVGRELFFGFIIHIPRLNES